MWKKTKGILMGLSLCLGFSFGAVAYADTATSQAGITFKEDPTSQTLKEPNPQGNQFPTAEGKTPYPTLVSTIGELPKAGDTFPYGAVLLGVALLIASALLYRPSLLKIRARKEK